MAKKTVKKAHSLKASVGKPKAKAKVKPRKQTASARKLSKKSTRTVTAKQVHRFTTTGAGAKLAGKVGSTHLANRVLSSKQKTAKDKPLSPEDLEYFRERLLNKRKELLGNVTRMRAEALDKNRQDAAGNLSKFPTSPADLGSDNYELEFTLSLMEGERNLLREIEDALGRINQGTYGICEGTGNPILRDRLEFEPWARYTVEHAGRLEKGAAMAQAEEPEMDFEPEQEATE